MGPIEYKKRPQSAKKIIKKGDKKEFKNPFKPAALKKNEAFSNIIEQYGEDPKVIDELVEAHSMVKSMIQDRKIGVMENVIRKYYQKVQLSTYMDLDHLRSHKWVSIYSLNLRSQYYRNLKRRE